MSRILVSGSIAYDRVMDFPGLFKDHFLPDQLHNINLSFQVQTVADNFGGCSGNIAYNLKLLGEEATIISVAGNDFSRYEDYLRLLGIDTGTIHIDEKLPTSMAFIMTDKADNQIAAFSMGAAATPYEPLPYTGSASFAIVSAGNPDDIRALPEHYRKEKLPYFYDPGQAILALSEDDLRNGIESSIGVFGNDYEVKLMTEKIGWSEAQILEKSGMLITTFGGKGSRVVSKEGKSNVPAVPTSNPIDPTGAGDAYRAGFIAGHLHTLPPHICARIGSTVAVYAVEAYGTQTHRFSSDELRARYKNAYGEEFPLK